MKRLVLAALVAVAACATPAVNSQTKNLPPDAIYVDPAAAGWNAAALADLVTYVKGQKSTGLVVIQNQRIIAEHNWQLGDDAATFRTNFTHGAGANGALLE